MRRTGAGEATGLGFDHGLEVVTAPGALLLPRFTRCSDIVFRQGREVLAVGERERVS